MSDTSGVDALVGIWHVLIHYREPGSRHPDRWHWDDRIWVLAWEAPGERLRWTEHPLVHFQDESGRFENLGTNRARRLLGAWEPNAQQREELALGLLVSERASVARTLAQEIPGLWRSLPEEGGTPLAAGAFAWSSRWELEAGPLPRFEQRGAIRSEAGEEEAGRTRYRTLGREGEAWVGDYERDGRRVGRFRMSPTHVLVRTEEGESPAAALLRLDPGVGARSGVAVLLSMLRYRYYHSERVVRVETTPPGADVDFTYLRRGTQLVYRKGRAPVRVEIPARIRTGEADRIVVRARHPGYERRQLGFDADAVPEDVQLDLVPVANRLEALAHRRLAGHEELTLLTRRPAHARGSGGATGYTLVLARTALPEALASHAAALQAETPGRLGLLQLGEDLVLRLAREAPAAGPAPELRTRSAYDPVRQLHLTRLVLGAPALETARVEATHAALGRIDAARVGGCARDFDAALREALTASPEEALALRRALSGYGGFPGPTLRAAMRRLGALDPEGQLVLTDGRRLSAGTPIELELALSEAARVQGFLALLRALAAELEGAEGEGAALRGLVAPERSPGAFGHALARARGAEAACRAR